MQKRQIIILVSACLLIGVGVGVKSFLSSFETKPVKKQKPLRDRYVKIDTVSYKKISPNFSVQGRLAPADEVNLTAEAMGKIQSGTVRLKKGTSFKKGDVLFTIYRDEVALQLKANKSRFMNIVANILPDLKVDYSDAFPAYKAFFDKLSPDEVLPAFPEVTNNSLKVFLATRNVLSEYYTIQKMELTLSRHSFVAPFDGSISALQLQEGSFAGVGARIGSIINTQFLELEVPVEPERARFISTGTEITVSHKGTQYPGKVVRKSAFIDRQTQTQTVFVQVPNAGKNKLYSGQYLTAEFSGFYIDSAMEIPRNALFNGNNVFLVVDGRLKKSTVTILSLNADTAIIEGLEEGSLVVVEPLINAKDNTKVIPLARQERIN